MFLYKKVYVCPVRTTDPRRVSFLDIAQLAESDEMVKSNSIVRLFEDVNTAFKNIFMLKYQA